MTSEIPIPLGNPPRSRFGRIGVAVTTGAVGVLVGGTVAWGAVRDDGATPVENTAATASETQTETDAMEGAHAAMGDHHHEALPPYADRYEAATDDEREAADTLLADVRTTLEAYADVDAAVAAGYEAPRHPRGYLTHYLNTTVAREGDVLDPAHPTGLVYFTGGDGDPVLLGAFFVTPAGTEAPTPAGDLVVWHSHSPDCPAFFATEDNPCLDARRMLHVWTADEVTLSAARLGRHGGRDRAAQTVQVVDPFGVPFRAAVEKVDG